jgi:hypothetical protein
VFALAKYSSPLITFYFYKKGYFVAEHLNSNLSHLMKVSTGIATIVILSYCIRGFGRSQNEAYRKFAKILEEAKVNPEAKKKLRMFDFEFEQWPIDWSVKSIDTKENKSKNVAVTKRGSVNWISPCSIAAYIAISELNCLEKNR